ncbi:hypothetical protein [Pseudomonas oryzihabitans]|uniref:hypothetical protein n=1 Tax=Pseudomonas oryzihabitans TaxID=47885 RepID=UPI0011A9CE76|nr:hypothetical protein [Pseudomonas oryzihabitans]
MNAPASAPAARLQPIEPAPIVRDADGWWFHPDFLNEPEFRYDHGVALDRYLAYCRSRGITTAWTALKDDDRVLFEQLPAEGDCDLSAWQPAPPAGDGWFLLSIQDAVDGPGCLWGRKVEQAQEEWLLEMARAHGQFIADRCAEILADGGYRPAGPVVAPAVPAVPFQPIESVPVERDEKGWWYHPRWLSEPEFKDLEAIPLDQYLVYVWSRGITTLWMRLEDEDPALFERYQASDDNDVSAWEVRPPEGEGWFLLTVQGTENGPISVWGQRVDLTQEEWLQGIAASYGQDVADRCAQLRAATTLA